MYLRKIFSIACERPPRWFFFWKVERKNWVSSSQWIFSHNEPYPLLFFIFFLNSYESQCFVNVFSSWIDIPVFLFFLDRINKNKVLLGVGTRILKFRDRLSIDIVKTKFQKGGLSSYLHPTFSGHFNIIQSEKERGLVEQSNVFGARKDVT